MMISLREVLLISIALFNKECCVEYTILLFLSLTGDVTCSGGDFRPLTTNNATLLPSATLDEGVQVSLPVNITELCFDNVIETLESFNLRFSLLSQSSGDLMYITTLTETTIFIADTSGTTVRPLLSGHLGIRGCP